MSTNRAKLTPAAGGVAYNPGDPFLMSDQGGFGPRLRDYHVGVDYRAPAGTPIPAASSGEVVYSGPSRGFHYAVLVRSVGSDGKSYYSVYGHVDPEDALAAGTKVSAGQTIGAVGTVNKNEGEQSTGPHLHFGIVPEEALNGRLVPGRDGLGFSTGETGLFVNPDEFANYADGAPYNARTYIPIRDGLAPRPVPYLAQSRETDRFLSQGNPTARSGLSPAESNRFYADTGNHSTDTLASITNGSLRVAAPNGVTSGPPASGFPRDNSAIPNPYLDAAQAAQRLLGIVPASNAPPRPMRTIPDGTINPVPPLSVPNAPAPQNNKRSALPDGVAPTLVQAPSPSALSFAPPGANAPASLFTRLLSAGPNAALAADDSPSPPLQPDATPDAADNGPTRFLARRTYDPSQGSPFAAQPAPSQPSADGSLSVNDAYLEYLRRLNVA